MKSTEALQRLREVLRRQHKTLSTERSYVYWLTRYIAELPKMSESFTSEQKVERFLTLLAVDQDVSASTQNQAFNALAYFYKDVIGKPLQGVDALRATRPVRLRHAPTRDETRALLESVRDYGRYPTRLVARLLYGCGLRVTEPLNLRVKDLQLGKSVMFIREAKGGKDRAVALPRVLADQMALQLERARSTWRLDHRDRIPVEMPHQLAKKYPEFPYSWGWAWVFPAHNTCLHPRTGQVVRYRMHQANVQRAIRDARRRLGILVLPNELRHAYATLCLERGTNPRAIQEAMGHKSLETTKGYLHAESLSVASPLEGLLS